MCRMKTGIFGISLKLQCNVIAAIQMVSGIALTILACSMLSKPENFILNYSLLNDKMKSHFESIVGENGIELLIAALTTVIGTVALILGLRKNSTGLILPWIVITIVDFAGGCVIFITKLASRQGQIRPFKVVAILAYFVMLSYFISSVYCYYQILKRQKRNARLFLGRSNVSLNSSASGAQSVATTTTEMASFPLPNQNQNPQNQKQCGRSRHNSSDDDEFILYKYP